MENYNVSSNTEIMLIVRFFKDKFFEEHRAELTKKGHSSSKSGFFLSVGETFSLPQNLKIGDRTFVLK